MRATRMAIILTLLLNLPLWANPKGLTRAQARELLFAALKARGYPTKSPSFSLEDRRDRYIPDFYAFDAYSNLRDRLVSTGHFAVNRKTADIWEDVTCKRLDIPSIKEAQEKLRREIGLTEKEYKSLSAEPPCRTE